MTSVCHVGKIEIGSGRRPVVIAGPCVLESLELGLEIGTTVRDVCRDGASLPYVFKASFDKANRSSIDSPRGPGLETGLAWLGELRERLGVPVTTDVHEPDQCDAAAAVVDLIQIPAFLSRQTDLLVAAGRAAAKHGCAVNVKKGQFMSPMEMGGPVRKLDEAGCRNIVLTERGTFFGYGRLVNDFIGVAEMMEIEGPHGTLPVCFDCTHSTQRPGPGGDGRTTGGAREHAPMLARAAVAAGVHAVFLECHPEPARALSDAATMLPLATMPDLLASLGKVYEAVSGGG